MTKEKRVAMFEELAQIANRASELIGELKKDRRNKDYPICLMVNDCSSTIYGCDGPKFQAQIQMSSSDDKESDFPLDQYFLAKGENITYPHVTYRVCNKVAFFRIDDEEPK